VAVLGTAPDLPRSLRRIFGRRGDPRVSVVDLPGDTPLPVAYAAALGHGAAPWVTLLGASDALAPHALATLSNALGTAEVVYADEDQIDDAGRISAPRFKPEYSPDLLLTNPYLGRPLVMARDRVLAAGGIRPIDGDWEHDLMLRVTEGATVVTHVPEVLCHRGPGASSPSGGAPVTVALDRRGEAASVEKGPMSAWRIRRHLTHPVAVSAIVPFRDGPQFLRACVDSVRATTAGADLELLLVDNGSVEPETLSLVDRLASDPDVTVMHDARPFNWAALNNAAVARARGDVLLFLNNDIEAGIAGWLEALTAQALRPDVAAVGARLLYPDRRVQHAGVVIGMGGAAGHVLAGLPEDQAGYLGMAVLTRECSAVTGACLCTRRSVFDELGGFDEELGLDMNDIDYCLRARARGRRVIYEPLAELIHHESPSRGTSGSVANIRRFVDRWEAELLLGDPFLNPNLTRVDSSCALRGPNEEKWWQEWRTTLNRM
jgi:GT2 family glycosyltransferase